MLKFLDLHKQYTAIQKDIDKAIRSVIADSAFIGGKYVRAFEENFAEYVNAEYCVGVGNGTDAIEIALEALDIEKGSEIIVPANSFIASSEAITRSGCKVVFCDCNNDDYTLSIANLRNRITSKTTAVIAVHLYGHPCDMDALTSLARDFDLKIIEDCAQAHGAEYKGSRVGTLGDIGTFSFYPGKNLGAYGDGGAIVTNDRLLATRCRMIANHGRLTKYDHEFEGRNSRLDGIQAAILDVKLSHLEDWTNRRISIADSYSSLLKNTPGLALPVRQVWARHVYHLFVLRTNKRDELREHLNAKGIQTGIHYPLALPSLSAYRYLDQNRLDMNAVRNAPCLLSLPMGDHLSDGEVHDVINGVNSFFD